MKKKSKQLTQFIENLHRAIVRYPLKDVNLENVTEKEMQLILRSALVDFLKNYFKKSGYVRYEAKALDCCYAEIQKSAFKKVKKETFASRNYPDFIITEPYLIAIECKLARTGAIVKRGIGQSIIHTLSGEFDFAYCVVVDRNKDRRIAMSLRRSLERHVVDQVWEEFNTFVRVI